MSCSLDLRRSWIQPAHPHLTVRRQCALLGLPAASYYYQATPESAENLLYQRMLDEEYTRHPFYGVRKMTVWLRLQGHLVGPKRVRRLLRAMGLMAVYPKPRLSLNPLAHQRFPYLLKGLAIVRPNQVWSTDITYIRLRGGFVYLAAVKRTFDRRGARAKAQSSPPCSFIRLIMPWIAEQFHHLKLTLKLSRQWGAPQSAMCRLE